MTVALRNRDRAIAAVAALVVALGHPAATASVEEAHRSAMKAAEMDIEDGFSVRGEPWSGRLAPGGRTVLKHQLFRGNEYWFWLGTPVAGAGLTVKVYDQKGRPVHVETKSGERWSAARVLPPKTGFYIVLVSAPAGAKEAVAAFDWSLSYGFR